MTNPIEPNDAWDIKDPSKLSTFLDCPRWYFYNHILGWQPEQPSHDAYFGESWHKAREYMLIHGYEDLEGAFDAFLTHYRKEYDDETDEMFLAKSPQGALNAMLRFTLEYKDDLLLNDLLYTEISGTVPVDEHRFLNFRMDSIMRNKETGKVFSWDHKTTSESRLGSRYWSDEFYLSLQTGTYTHCMYCMYPMEEVKGVEYCGTGFVYLQRGSKARPAGFHASFRRVPAWKSPEQMNVWLWTTINILDEIEKETDRLYHCNDSDKVLMAFPMNPKSCTKYFGCPFHDYCLSWENPLQNCYEPPLGFIKKFWDPREMQTTNKMNLEWR